MTFFAELRRRNVIRMAGLYLVAAWLIVQVSSTVLPMFEAPAWLPRAIVIALMVGFLPAMIVAWVFEFTPEGIRFERDVDRSRPVTPRTGRRIDRTIIVVLALGFAYLAFDKFVLAPRGEAAIVAAGARTGTGTKESAQAHARSVAVLPFENLSADPDNAYFASGMQEMILTRLAGIAELKVISRTSTAKYASHPDDLKAIAQQLGVATILEGSVQKAGNSALINVQLIDAGSDAHLWAEAYTRTLDNVFDVEGDVAQKVADALRAHLSAAEQRSLSTPPTRNAEAYNLYLQGDYYLRQTEADNADPAVVGPRALALYAQATARDPSFAQAFARMAYVRALLYWDRIEVAEADIGEAERLARHALELNPESAEGHMAKGYVVYWGRRDYAQALSEFAQAQRLQPNDARVAFANAFVYRRQGNWQASVEAHERAAWLAPRDAGPLSDMGYTLALVRRYADADAALDRSLALIPGYWDAWSGKALVAVYRNGDTDAARAAMRHVTADVGPSGSVAFVRFEVAMWSHDFDAAIAALDGAPGQIHTNPGHDLVPTDLLRAQAHEAAGRTDAARASYESAIRGLESEVKRQPTEAPLHAFLARAYAGGGRNEDAVREGRRAVELLPVKDDAFSGPFLLADLAKTYARIGDADAAIPLIRQLLAMSAGLAVSVPILKVDPAWDPIRRDPRFGALLAETAP